MIPKGKRYLWTGLGLVLLFGLWTVLVQWVDVETIGETETQVGFSTLNGWFHRCTGVHLTLYTLTDWLGLVPIFICFLFAGLGLVQLIRRKHLFRVDIDLLLLGVYYIVVIGCYLLFEMIPINYRPIFIEGRLEASYPSSTTLLVVSVMPTLAFQASRRLKSKPAKWTLQILSAGFSIFMVVGRLISGVHWLTDIVGAVLLSTGLFRLYQAAVLLQDQKEQ